MGVATSAGSVSVGVRDLKNRLSAYLDLVKGGQQLVVTERGRPIARLSPLGPDADRMQGLVESGIVLPAPSKARRLPAERVTLRRGTSLDDDVAAQRG